MERPKRGLSAFDDIERLDQLGEVGKRRLAPLSPPRELRLRRAELHEQLVQRDLRLCMRALVNRPAFMLLARDVGLAGFALRIERIETPARGPPPKTCGCRRRNGSSRAPGSCFDGVQPFRFSECISSPVERLSGVACCSRRPVRQPEESGSGPLGAGNVERDLGQRTVGLALELEAVIGNADRVGSPMPFAWLVRSGALAAALAPISGPFVATESFWSRLPAAVRPCPARDPNATEPEELDAAADQFGRRAARVARD